jgi:hypothetical protein
VFVLTGGGTCSASEAFMNGLRGVGVEVIQIGSTTCGKPYGFYAQENCGTTYFSIQFRLVINASDCILIDQRNESRHMLKKTECVAE